MFNFLLLATRDGSQEIPKNHELPLPKTSKVFSTIIIMLNLNLQFVSRDGGSATRIVSSKLRISLPQS